MNKQLLKTPGFWIALVMSVLGLLLANGVITDGSAAAASGWILTIATTLGYKALSDKPAELPETTNTI